MALNPQNILELNKLINYSMAKVVEVKELEKHYILFLEKGYTTYKAVLPRDCQDLKVFLEKKY